MDIVENGVEYRIENGLVVEASVTDKPTTELEIQPNDRISYRTKLGTVVGLVASIYGDTAIVRFDDGSLDELHVDDLKLSSIEKVAAVVSDNLIDEYEAYLEMPTATSEDLKIKEAKAREINLRAKAHVTNGRIPLAEQTAYDRIVTATAVDILDLKEAGDFEQAREESYTESLPQFRLPEEVSGAFGPNRGGDASWLFDTANDMTVSAHEDAELVSRANNAISQFSRAQLEDDNLMDLAVSYATDSLVAPEDTKEKFGYFFREARVQRLADEESFTKEASVFDPVDLNGNSFSYEDTPVEAIFGE